ncbi:PTS sugar transporter subunit IIB [Heyndrickxia faecalis]|jgi:PTS system mannose-specific IIB component|uniref:PTS sugar transporter subunit IIB n=1 Tax=Heyndrickxia faecalis TaxID=2824910 RepID=UPI003D195C7A
MIVALRVDERLIHGQVAMTWTKALKLDGLVVANDEAANNEIQKMSLKMAVPQGIKCIIKTVESAIQLLNDPRAQKMRLMVLVTTVKDAVTICERFQDIELVNIGNAGKMTDGEKIIFSKEVMLTQEEIDHLETLVKLYPNTEFQPTPAMEKKLAVNILKNIRR